MTRLERFSFAILCTVSLNIAQPSSAIAGDPYPLEYFALREVVSSVAVSPSGERLAMLRILSRDGDPILHIYDTDKRDQAPVVVDADPMEIRDYYWVNDENLVLILRQKVRSRIEGQNQGVYESKITRLNLKEMKFEDFDLADPVVESIVEREPNKIIVSTQPGMEDDISLATQFRPRAYYLLDLERGTKRLLVRGKIDLGQIEFDADGDPWLARGFERAEGEYVWYDRPKGGKGWDPVFRLDENSFERFVVFGKDAAMPGNWIVGANNGHDTAGLWSYSTEKKAFDELIYRRSDVDIYGVRVHSNRWKNPQLITAVSYYKDKFHYEYFDEIEGATFAQLEELIPNAFYVAIDSRSRDGDVFTVFNQGPRDPGTYYLYNKGEFSVIGSQQPLIDAQELADIRYITYEARDGRKIPAFVTVPNGEGPFPLVVMPHGGPFVQEVVVYDEWAQMLANNGYMVVQPQYRGSQGYGLEHYLSAFINGGEGGRKMQDDKDDAALYLIEQGLADPGRIAMFGWSYGGYAALVAASRSPQIYQCTIAGAAVADQIRQLNEYANDDFFRGAVKEEQVTYRRDSVNPIDEVDKVNVPILLIHGSVDQRVQPYHARIYRDKLDQRDKTYKFVELEGADHFSNTLFFEHQIVLYTAIIDFLENDCGQMSLRAQAKAAN
jgi:dipeptidyl aminopeptidase/acylaminoacyl peptidase